MKQNACTAIVIVLTMLALVGCGTRKESAADKTETSNEIAGVVWQWVHSLYNNDTEAVPPEPSEYTLEFRTDGTVSIQADSIYGGGSYTTEGSSLTIEIDQTTKAACPEGSLEEQFIKDLNAAAIYFFKDGDLYLDLKYDTGTMKFRKAEI